MPQYIFFSGKGGVGKTTLSAVTSVYYSSTGKRTLLVSTDPAGNLGDIFECEVGVEPFQIMDKLSIVQMDSNVIKESYKNRILQPLSDILDEFALAQVKEEFDSGCTVEIATFDKFTDFLEEDSYDVIVFDTAPTGHTLRLMTLPRDWDIYIQKSAQGSGQTCIGPVAQIEGARKKYQHAVQVMQDASRTTVYLISRPDKTSVFEALRAKKELERTGIHNFQLIINGILPHYSTLKGVFASLAQNQKKYIDDLRMAFGDNFLLVPMQSFEIKGLNNIKLLSEIVFEHKSHVIQNKFKQVRAFENFDSIEKLISLLEKNDECRSIILTGKGGVGKTVAACAIAYHLEKKGKTLLLTTDPAAHIGQVLGANVNHLPVNIIHNLWAVNIDQKAAVEEYRQKILNQAQAQAYTADLLASLEEELESPCIEEIAVFEQFAHWLNQTDWDYFVLDTAPTGHTLRLLELPFEYQKQIAPKGSNILQTSLSANIVQDNNKILKLINHLRNNEKTTFFLVAYPEYTPLYEGHRAMKDLERVGIKVQGILLNHILNYSECLDDFSLERWNLQQNYLYLARELFSGKFLFPIFLRNEEIIGLKSVINLENAIFCK